jgi:DNA mismatch repair protein MutL
MFPKTIELNNSDFELIREVLDEIKNIGFDIEIFGKNTLAINGLPIGVEEANCEKIIEEFIEQVKNNANEISAKNKTTLAMSLARSASIKNGRKLSLDEMNTLVDQLFACDTPYLSPNGKPIIIKIKEEELDQRFDKK